MSVLLLSLLELIALPANAAAGAQVASTPAKTAQVLERVEEYLERASAFGFSGSALVAAGDEVLLSRGFGVADAKTGRACAPDTLYDLGSLSKQFTASLVLVLEARGVLKVDDALPKFFDDVPEDKRRITLHHLLRHTSGLPRALATVGSRATDREKMIREALAAPLAAAPGERFAYSNLGYELLAAAIERAAGLPFEDLMREAIFAPAGMTSTGFRRDGRLDATRAARGQPSLGEPPAGSLLAGDPSRFEGSFDEKLLAIEGWWSWGLRGADGVLSTVEDLWRWERDLRGERILSADAKRRLFDPGHGDYAYGWYVVETARGRQAFAHGGTTGNGFDVYATRVPADAIFHVALGNALGVVPWVHANVGRLLRGEKVELPPAPDEQSEGRLASAGGDYRVGRDGHFRLHADDGSWNLEAMDEESFAALHGATPDVARSRVESCREILRGFAERDFAAVHASASREHPLSYLEDWWDRLLRHHGPLREARLLGAAPAARSPGATVAVLARLEFERGFELLTLQWSGTTLTGLNIGPPYPSRLRLVPVGEREAAAYDLVEGRETARLELAADGRSAELRSAGGRSRLRRE